jgi:16S rRNA (adenine1518-N6/adenine1519-N6)-dimethyltransferase
MYKPIKGWGQNFLLDRRVVAKLVDALDLVPGDTVVEIGPGLGILTEELGSRLDYKELTVYAVEIDIRFVEKLQTMFLSHPNLHVIEANILDWLPQFESEKPYKILGSLPYYITSPIVHTIVKMRSPADICVLLIQKEVAEKITAKAPDSSYLSVFVQTFYEVSYLGSVDKSKFSPPPKVDGGLIKLVKREEAPIWDMDRYEGFLHRAYSSPRKMLNKVFSKEELDKAGLDASKRPHDYGREDWVKAFKAILQQ